MKYVLIFFIGFGAQAESWAIKDWRAIWTQKNQLKALREYKEKHGLFLETDVKAKEAVMVSEGACGDEFVSLVKSTKTVTGRVWEIDKKGNILQLWHPGIETPLYIKGKKLYRDVVVFEDPAHFNPKKRTAAVKSHKYLLEVDSNNQYEIVGELPDPPEKTDFEKINCHKHVRAESDFKYCVREPKTGRLFVFEGPCT